MSSYRNRHVRQRQHGGMVNALSLLAPSAMTNASLAVPSATGFNPVGAWAAQNILPTESFPSWQGINATSVALSLAPNIQSVLRQLSTSITDPNVVNSAAPTRLSDLSDIVVQNLSDMPPLEEVWGQPMTPAGGVREQYENFKTSISDAATYLKSAGSDGIDAALTKLDGVVEIFRNLPATASDILDVKNLVDQTTTALEAYKDSSIEVTSKYVEIVRDKAIEAVQGGRVYVENRLSDASQSIQSAGIVTGDAVRTLSQMFNDLEVMAIVEPRYQYVAGLNILAQRSSQKQVRQGRRTRSSSSPSYPRLRRICHEQCARHANKSRCSHFTCCRSDIR